MPAAPLNRKQDHLPSWKQNYFIMENQLLEAKLVSLNLLGQFMDTFVRGSIRQTPIEQMNQSSESQTKVKRTASSVA